MDIYLYNTLSREKEKLKVKDNLVKMYTCGPTVYNFAHIGNFRTYVFEDLLRRFLQYMGFDVEQVMNITDVDDKTIKGAIENKQSLQEYTQTFKKSFFEDIQTLNIEKVEHYPEATAYVQEMVKIIEGLLKNKHAYVGQDKSVYFSITSFPSYGKLSHLKQKDLKTGASNRVSDEYDKENASDFVLWKAYDEKRDGGIFWESPFGKGRPGWHIECSAMAMAILGKTIDIHCGGIDNIFPHHENEIAQSECYSKKTFAHYWLHAAHLVVDNKKMSKSLNNFYTLRDLLQKGYSGMQIRYMLLQTHYRMSLNFTFQELDAVKASLQRLNDCIARLQKIERESVYVVKKDIVEAEDEFQKALCDDLNISQGLAVVFTFVRLVNTLCDEEKIGTAQAREILDFFMRLDQVLGVMTFEDTLQIPFEIHEALQKRQKARKEKDFSKADELRDFIHSKGYVIEDTPKGAIVKKR
jgi:cysteinyl-tRNA synthetase